MVLSHYLNGRDNNFNLIRFLAASAVIVTHAPGILSGYDTVEPLQIATGFTLGYHAVTVFFVLSGFLIAASLDRNANPIDYFTARGLRLLPALVVTALVTAFVIGPVFTVLPLGDYFSDLRTWIYTPLTGGLVSDDAVVPGLFAGAPIETINMPLWTLRYEAAMYVGLALVFYLGAFATKSRFTIYATAGIAGYLALTLLSDLREQIQPLDHLARFALCYLVGSALYVYRDQLRLHWSGLLAGFALAWLAKGTALAEPAVILLAGYAVVWFGFIPNGLIRRFNRLGDVSYGLYIYGWLALQIVALTIDGLTSVTLFALAFPLALAAAIASWVCVEKPMLARRKQVAAGLRRLTGSASGERRSGASGLPGSDLAQRRL